MRLQFLNILFFICFLSTCTKKTLPSDAKQEIIAPAKSKIKPLGSAFKTLTNDFVGENICMTSNLKNPDGTPRAPQVVYSPIGTLQSGVSESTNFSSDQFNVGAEIRVGIDLGIAAAEVNGGINVATTLQENELKTSMYTTFNYVAGNVLLLDPTLTPYGKETLALDERERFARCGDEYLSQIQLGGRLHAGLEFSFASKQMKNEFDLKVKMTLKALGASTTQTLLDESVNLDLTNITGAVTLILEQEGGDQTAFNHFLDNLKRQKNTDSCIINGTKAVTSTETGDGARIVTAKLEGYEKCIEAYTKDIIAYANQQFPRQFKPLKEVAHDLPNSNYNALRYYTKPYRKAGFIQFANPIHTFPQPIRNYIDLELYPLLMKINKLSGQARALKNIVQREHVFKSPELQNRVNSNLQKLDFFEISQNVIVPAHFTTDIARDIIKKCQESLERGIIDAKIEQAIASCRQRFQAPVLVPGLNNNTHLENTLNTIFTRIEEIERIIDTKI